jgi:hypothetical protein
MGSSATTILSNGERHGAYVAQLHASTSIGQEDRRLVFRFYASMLAVVGNRKLSTLPRVLWVNQPSSVNSRFPENRSLTRARSLSKLEFHDRTRTQHLRYSYSTFSGQSVRETSRSTSTGLRPEYEYDWTEPRPTPTRPRKNPRLARFLSERGR